MLHVDAGAADPAPGRHRQEPAAMAAAIGIRRLQNMSDLSFQIS